ncbi:hypothetical protein GGF31_002467 [Allomyces arbusculus]|nr:hypothetical protein GGF31_002467 [Allomyces arbusculus]
MARAGAGAADSSNARFESTLASLRNALRSSPVTKWAVISSAAQAVIQLALETGVALAHGRALDKVPPNVGGSTVAGLLALGRAMTVYHYIFMMASILQLLITLDAILNQNSIELISLNILNVGLFGYSVMQAMQASDLFAKINFALAGTDTPELKPASAVVQYPSMAISALFLAGTVYSSYRLHKEFGWAIYKRIGADIGLRRQMMAYFFLMMLLKLDVFFYFTFSLQFLVIGFVDKPNATDMIIHVAVSLVMIFVLWFLCVRGTRRESSKLMFGFMGGTLACMAYLALKLYQANHESRFAAVKKSMSFSIALCLVLALATLTNAIICFRNFGTGLATHLRRQQQRTGPAPTLAHELSADGFPPGPPLAAQPGGKRVSAAPSEGGAYALPAYLEKPPPPAAVAGYANAPPGGFGGGGYGGGFTGHGQQPRPPANGGGWG